MVIVNHEKTYTRTPVTIEAINVPSIANVTMAPKFEKNGFCNNDGVNHIRRIQVGKQATRACTHTSKLKVLRTYR
jgi:hypothetical protein